MKQRTITRRDFVKTVSAAGVASGAVACGSLAGCAQKPEPNVVADAETPGESGSENTEVKHDGLHAYHKGMSIEATVDPQTGKVVVNEDVIVRYTACLGCYAACGKRVKIDRATGEMLNTGGNPYHPSCAYPNLAFEDSLEDAFRSMSVAPGCGNENRGTSCGRGHATQDGYAQPDRITMPLKRAGKRGEGKWVPISWDQLITEVVEGGKLFADLGEDREIEGFRAIYDNETPMDPENPKFGPKSEQLVLMGGRAGDGRSPFSLRFGYAFGTNNFYGHTSSCGGASWAWTLLENSAVYTYPDLDEAEYVLWLGEFPGANGKSIQSMSKRITDRCIKGECTMDVLDPTLGNGCVTPGVDAIRWVPIKTQTDAAFALALVRWMMEHDAVNTEFLACPNLDAAKAKGYASFTNAGLLVIADENHPKRGMFLRAEDAGLEAPELTEEQVAAGARPDWKVVMNPESGQPELAAFATSSTLDFEGEVNGVKVRSSYLFLKDSAFERTLEEASGITGVPTATIERIAKEFSSHGTKVSVGCMGATAGARGIQGEWAHLLLKAMVGGNQVAGGSMPAYVDAGPVTTNVDQGRYLMFAVPNLPMAAIASSTYISRTGLPFETTDEYVRRVAAGEENPKPLLPWFGINRGSDTQALISMANGYPYKPKIVLTWMFNTLQSTSGAMRESILERLQNPDYVPLHIVCDVVLGEHTLFADYVVPDTTPYESFGVVSQQLDWRGKGNAVRWPVVEPKTIKLDDGRHASYEAFLIDVAKACGLPGFGDMGIFDATGTPHPLNDACDYFIKCVANLAYIEEPVADIDPTEARWQGLDELPEAWKAAVSEEEWPKVLNVLSRGGRFWPVEECVDENGHAAYGSSQETYVYSEKCAMQRSSLSGKTANPVLTYEPEQFGDDSLMTAHYSEKDFPFKATNYKPRFRSVSMLANSPIMQDMCPENFLEINDEDALELGIQDGDTIRVVNPGGDVMEGPAMVRGGIAKGTIAVAHGYGHFGYGAQHVEVEGQPQITGDSEEIGAGIHLQTMLDPTLPDVLYPICDPVSAAPARSGAQYRIEKI